MIVLGVNKVSNWCQVLSGGRRYTCPIKVIDGELLFRFKKEWHSVVKLASDHAEELIYEGGRLISRPLRK